MTTVHSRVDGDAHVGEVSNHHADVNPALHTYSDWTLSNEKSSAIAHRLVSDHTDLGGGQLWWHPCARGRRQGSSRCQLAHHGDEAGDAHGADGIHVEVQRTVRSSIRQLGSRVGDPSHQNGAVHLASKLRFTIARRRTRPDDCVDIIAHADHGDEGLQHVECAVRIGGLAHACLSPRRLVNFDLGLGQHTSSSVGRICRQRTNLTLLVVLGILSASALHGLEDDLLRRAVLLDALQGIGFQSHFGVQAQVRLPLEGAEIQSLTESPCFRHGHETHHAKAHRQNQSSLLHPTAGARWRVFRLFLGLRMDGLERCRHGRRISERFGTQAGGIGEVQVEPK